MQRRSPRWKKRPECLRRHAAYGRPSAAPNCRAWLRARVVCSCRWRPVRTRAGTAGEGQLLEPAVRGRIESGDNAENGASTCNLILLVSSSSCGHYARADWEELFAVAADPLIGGFPQREFVTKKKSSTSIFGRR
jgi:hypothetical protein